MSLNRRKYLRIFLAISSLLIVHAIATKPNRALAAAEGERALRLTEEAKKEGRLVFYSGMTAEDSSRLVNRFKEKYPFLEPSLTRISGNKMINKILAEAKGNIHPDVVVSDGYVMHFLKTEGLLKKYLSPERKAYAEGFKDADGYHTSLYTTTNVIAYNTKLVPSPGAPKGYQDLLDPKWKGKMGIVEDDIQWFSNMLKILGQEKGLQFMIKLSSQNPVPRQGHTQNTVLLAAGEFYIAVNVYGHRIEKLKEEGAPVEWVRSEPIVTHLNPIAISSNAPHPNAAMLFIDFMLSKEAQMMIRNFRRIPSRLDVEPDPPRLVRGLKLVPDDLALSAEMLSGHAKLFRETFETKR